MGNPIGSFWMTPHDIYVQLTGGPGSKNLDMAQQAVSAIWRGEAERAELIRKQGELIQSGWQGAASDAASGAAHPLARSAMSGVDQLAQAQDVMDRQSGSFNRAKNDVVPVPPEPPEFDIFDPGFVFTDYEKQVTAYQADAQHNIDVFSGYDGASSYNETRMPPDYATTAHSGGGISVVAGSRGGSGDHVGVTEYVQPRGEPDGHPASGGSPGSAPPSGAQPPSQTAPSDVVPPAGNPPGHLPPAQPAPTGPGPSGVVTGVPVGGPPAGAPPGGATRGPGAHGGPGGRGPGGGPGGGRGMGGRALGAGPGVGPLVAEEAAAQRAAAAGAVRGAGSGMVGGPAGAGRGKGDEDEEHKRKVLIETDSESAFGTDVLTAPQVIGDDAYEDD